MRLGACILAAILIAVPFHAGGQGFDSSQLPKLGDAGSGALSAQEQARIGRSIVGQLREAGALVEDPEIENYVRSVGQRLVAHSTRPEEHYEFFVVNDTGINAFALPGGYIGINIGLILASDTEAELAGVMAHEIAHVTQRHIARRIEDAQTTGLATLGAILAAILVGAQTGQGDIAAAGAMSAQALQARRQLSFSRAHEHEADRIGIRMMARAGYDPKGMADFFETLQQRHRHAGDDMVPEYLRTHPLTATRLTEARERAREYAIEPRESSRSYYLTRARLDAKTAGSPLRDLMPMIPSRMPANEVFMEQIQRYTDAMQDYFQGRSEQAAEKFAELVEESEDVIAYHRALADALMAQGKTDVALEHYSDALRLFPGNVALLEGQARILMDIGQPARAAEVFAEILNSNDAKPRHFRLRARAESEAGNTADSHYYLAHYNFAKGNLLQAMTQIRMAQTHPSVRMHRTARYNRLAEEIRIAWEQTPPAERQAQRERQ